MPFPKYQVGQTVEYTNDYGVKWGKKKIVAIVENLTYDESGFGYKIEPTDTPWFAVPERNLKPIKKEL